MARQKERQYLPARPTGITAVSHDLDRGQLAELRARRPLTVVVHVQPAPSAAARLRPVAVRTAYPLLMCGQVRNWFSAVRSCCSVGAPFHKWRIPAKEARMISSYTEK